MAQYHSVRISSGGCAAAASSSDEWLAASLVGSTTLVPIVWDKWVASLISADAITKAGTFWKQYISAVVGKKQIGSVTEGDLQEIIVRAAKKGLAWKSLSNIRSTLAGFVKWSRKNRYTTITTEDLDIPKNAPKGKKAILQPTDIIKMWSVKQTPYSNLFKLAVLTGLRPGELIGLQWKDIIDSRLHVQRAINYSGEITEGKNENAQRYIWLGEYEQFVDQSDRLRFTLDNLRQSIRSAFVPKELFVWQVHPPACCLGTFAPRNVLADRSAFLLR